MAIENATILIPDISGYTEFVSRTELDHSSHILNHLLETIVESFGEDFVVSEIEGDAVLLYRKGEPPPKRAVIDQCSKTFTAFHRELRQMQSRSICQCGACQGVIGLTLKFVVHFGAIAEIKVARFVKASGLDMVIAHRLLKNSIERHEYLLLSRSYLEQVSDRDDGLELQWQSAQEEYPSIGVVRFDYAQLEGLRRLVPMLPRTELPVRAEGPPAVELEIGVHFRKLLQVLTDLDRRLDYVPGVLAVEGEAALPVAGSGHTCVFDEFRLDLEPIRVEFDDSGAEYAEFVRCVAPELHAVMNYRLTHLGAQRCRLALHILAEPSFSIPPPLYDFLQQNMQASMQSLQQFVENGSRSATH